MPFFLGLIIKNHGEKFFKILMPQPKIDLKRLDKTKKNDNIVKKN